MLKTLGVSKDYGNRRTVSRCLVSPREISRDVSSRRLQASSLPAAGGKFLRGGIETAHRVYFLVTAMPLVNPSKIHRATRAAAVAP